MVKELRQRQKGGTETLHNYLMTWNGLGRLKQLGWEVILSG